MSSVSVYQGITPLRFRWLVRDEHRDARYRCDQGLVHALVLQTKTVLVNFYTTACSLVGGSDGYITDLRVHFDDPVTCLVCLGQTEVHA